jgi:radical SAM superfamily enzyme YgiQ (UPF0313 family)
MTRVTSPVVVFLADLQNSYYRYIRNSVPIGMGYVAAYCNKVFGRDIEIHQFRKFEELHEALKSRSPQLVAFGSYSWNTQLTVKAARYLRSRLPAAIIAVGGPDVSEVVSLTAEELRAHPEVDFYLPNEGEAPTRNLVEALLGSDAVEVRRRDVHGCLSLDPESGEVRGDVIARFEGDINDIPSPYCDGLMDRFLAEPDYLPIIQTARGCPYQCTFCVSGKDSWNKVKAFAMERVKAEIDYIEKRAVNRYLRLADENFGILHRDIEIADYLARKRKDSGFPTAVSVYTDKHPTDRVKSINLLMRDLLPFNISYQSMTDEVLTNIKRVNLKDCRVAEAVAFARANDLMLVSELIFALPGETLQSFLASIDRLVELRFESIALHQLRILKGTEMDLPEDRRRYGVRTQFAMSENGYTNHPELENIEIDEWVVENKTLTREDYFRANGFIFLFDFGHYRGMLREALFFFEALGVRTTEVLWRVAQDPARYPTAGRYAGRFVSAMQQFLFDTPDAVEAFVRKKMATNPSELEGIYRLKDRLMIELLMAGHLPQVVDEVADAGREIYRQRHGDFDAALLDQLELIKQIVIHCHIPLDRQSPEELAVVGAYDVAAWAQDRYLRPLGEYRRAAPIRIGLRIRNPENYHALWGNTDTLLERYKRHFLTINSSNRRRIIVPASEGEGPASDDPGSAPVRRGATVSWRGAT